MKKFLILAALSLSLSGCAVYTVPVGEVYVTPAPVVVYEPYYTYGYYGHYGWGRHRDRDHDHYRGEREHHHHDR